MVHGRHAVLTRPSRLNGRGRRVGGPSPGERRLRGLVGELERRYPSAAACLADDLPAVCIHLRYLPRLRKRFPVVEPARALA
jgi:hypothetical protein